MTDFAYLDFLIQKVHLLKYQHVQWNKVLNLWLAQIIDSLLKWSSEPEVFCREMCMSTERNAVWWRCFISSCVAVVGVDWVLLDACYLRADRDASGWRDFFSALGVRDLLIFRKEKRTFTVSELVRRADGSVCVCVWLSDSSMSPRGKLTKHVTCAEQQRGQKQPLFQPITALSAASKTDTNWL